MTDNIKLLAIACSALSMVDKKQLRMEMMQQWFIEAEATVGLLLQWSEAGAKVATKKTKTKRKKK